jgi:hypothetical protein
MAIGAVSLVVYQWVGMSRPPVTPVAEIVRSVPVVVAPQPVEPQPATVEPPPPPVVEEPKPVAPAFSEQELAAKKAEAARIELAAKAFQARGQTAAESVKDALESWKRLRGTASSSVIASQTAALERQAAVANIEALNRHYSELTAETAKILKAPKPEREALSGFSPVAKPAKGQEFHFEVRRDRLAFIDLQQMLELVKKDVQIRMRLSGSPRGIQSEVGPVGDFNLAYEIGPMNDAIGGTGVGLKGWELVPTKDPRGETVERAAQPLSEFDRAIKRLSPTSATITMWVYPDGFGTFRIMRDRLHALGFMVAARPLPEGVPVRGSPTGSISAGQ